MANTVPQTSPRVGRTLLPASMLCRWLFIKRSLS
jgi:hypothetical protein